ncbi:hypothetical protein [Marinifilum flexuosum]|uniref:hypothetical protein n=1 Tax=Marinifilum flexuosum TaxID=1117708 RepID=UPI00248FAFE4|nr:hypothetical protein [Marinifilum flexuosum]
MNLKTKQLSLIIAIFSTFTIACSSSDEEEIIEPVDPCADVVKDNSIISDFECQQNFFIGADASKETQAPAIDNTNKSGINTSNKVGKFIDDGSQAWDNLLIDFGSAYNLTDRSQLKIKVLAPKAGSLIAKLEGGSLTIEQSVQIEKINEWVECSFNFREAIDMDNTKLVLFFNAGADDGASEETYLIDDIRFVENDFPEIVDPCEGVEKDMSIISDFECQQNYFIGGDPTLDTQAPVTNNPDQSGDNTSEKVGKFIDNGTQAWDNMLIDFSTAYDLTNRSLLKMKVYTENTGILIAKLEGGDVVVEQQVQMETTGQWVEYSFNFREAVDMNNTKLILFFNAGAEDGQEEEVYYVDDIKFVENNIPVDDNPCNGVDKDMSIISDFECQHNYTFTGRLEAGIDNLYKAGINQSEKIGEFTDDGTNAWDFLLVDYEKAIDLSTKNKLKLMIHSDKAVQFLAKLEGGTSAAHEIWMDITTTGEWVEYTVDFSSQANENHNKVVLFFNAGKDDGGATDKYYLDNIRWE